MLSLSAHFDELLRNVGPDEGRLALARDLPPVVRDHLQQDDSIKTVEPHTLLIGSYDRHTAVGQLKDVDILVLIEGDSDNPGPRAALAKLRKSLANLPGATRADLTSQRRSVRVDLEDGGFTLDVVPARVPDGLKSPLLVPDRVDDEWLSSHPLGYAQMLAEMDEASGGKARQTIRLSKHWRSEHMKYRRPKSYLLEILVGGEMAKLDLTGKGQGQSFAEAMDAVYQRCEPAYLKDDSVPRVLDPMVRCDIASQWERDSFVAFMKNLSECKGWAEKALLLPGERHQEAVALWQRVFGEAAFPAYVDDCPYCEGEKMRSAQAVGALAVTHGAAPEIVIGRRSDATPVDPRARSWSDRGIG